MEKEQEKELNNQNDATEDKVMREFQSDDDIKKDIESGLKPKSKNIFAKNSLLNRILMAVGSLILVNVLFIATSFIIITMGAGFTALNTCVIKIKEEEDFKLVPTYFKAFASNFWDATLPWIVSLGLMSGCVFGIIVFITSFNGVGSVLGAGGCGLVAIVILGFMTYYFMLLSRYDNEVYRHIKNAFMCSAIYFFRSVPIWGIWILTVMPFVLIDELRVYAGWIWLMIGFSGTVYLTSFMYQKIFYLLETKQEEDQY